MFKLMHAGKDESMQRDNSASDSVESNSDEVHIIYYEFPFSLFLRLSP